MSGPLDGIRVLDASRLMPFSYTTHLLAESGAEVVKLEQPGGEYGRDMQDVFRLFNRGKRSLTLDLRTDEGREIALRLVEGFDVFVESFRPGFLDELGLGFEVMRERHPDLVYCSATGFGATGPYSHSAGHDLNYAALAGLLTPSGGAPVVAPVPYIDMAAGLSAAFAISSALVGARATGRAIHLDVAMSDIALSFNGLAVAATVRKITDPEGTEPEGMASEGMTPSAGPLAGYPWPALMRAECPCYGTYQTLDGRHVSLANVEPKFWAAFLDLVERSDLTGLRFATGAEGRAARDEIAAVIKSRSLAEWDTLFAQNDVCYAPVLTAAEAYRHPQFRSRAIVPADPPGTADGEPRLGLPMVLSEPCACTRSEVPAAGEANAELLGALGYSPDRQRELAADGVT